MFEKLVDIICNYVEVEVEVEQTEAANIRTVQEAVDYLEKLTAES